LDPVYFIQFVLEFNDKPIVLDPWQTAVAHDHSRMFAVEKAPQIGMSWLWAMEALWESMMFMDVLAAFVSVDQREAGQKIQYARNAYENLPSMIKSWVPKVKDSQEEMWFGDMARPSKIMSIPATSALRGWKVSSLFLDEIDFYQDGGENMFRVGIGRISRGGRMKLGSTCFGHDTKLDQVMQRLGDERDKDAMAKVKNFSLCRLPYVVESPETWETIELAYEEMAPSEFAEEYGCVRGGGISQSFSPELLRAAIHGDATYTDPMVLPRGTYVAGFDVGATRHPSVLSVLEKRSGGLWQQVCVMTPVNENGKVLTLAAQQDFLDQLLGVNKDMVLALDAQGIGFQIAQSLETKWGARVVAVHPSASTGYGKDSDNPNSRYEMALEVKRRLENGTLQLMADKEQMLQFRRTELMTGGRVEQPGSHKKTHYDRFWATVYAVYGLNEGSPLSIYNRKNLTVISAGPRRGREALWA
jgi:phage FluMu gp28-like protein